MTHRHQLTDAGDIRDFVLAGKAVFTLVSSVTGRHLTFKVSKAKDSKDKGPYFVAAMTGPDNVSSYTYMGHVFADEKGFELIPGSKGKLSPESVTRKAFEWLLKRISATKALPDGGEFWHEGRCGRCARRLTVPISIERGLGPICDPRDR